MASTYICNVYNMCFAVVSITNKQSSPSGSLMVGVDEDFCFGSFISPVLLTSTSLCLWSVSKKITLDSEIDLLYSLFDWIKI